MRREVRWILGAYNNQWHGGKCPLLNVLVKLTIRSSITGDNVPPHTQSRLLWNLTCQYKSLKLTTMNQVIGARSPAIGCSRCPTFRATGGWKVDTRCLLQPIKEQHVSMTRRSRHAIDRVIHYGWQCASSYPIRNRHVRKICLAWPLWQFHWNRVVPFPGEILPKP